ncbi:MAG: hypothetical protein EHM28_12095 [Spirochaetaceae bacterium]|nr:MAG: hypothetical protein EHM28_12095 [Spirochaetaceae bacterium]
MLQRKVEEMHSSGKKLVFLFDDFHKITSNKKFPLEFFSFLRSLANNYNLAYVTSSFLELQKLCVAKDIEESPFFNIFTNISLGLLARLEAVSLLSRLSGWDEKKSGDVVDWCGPSPYLVKLVAKSCQAGARPDDNYEKQFLPLFQDYFTHIMAVVPREAFKALKELVKGRQPDVSEAHLVRPLVRHRFLDEEEEKLSFFSEAFRMFAAKSLKEDMLKGACKNATP